MLPRLQGRSFHHVGAPCFTRWFMIFEDDPVDFTELSYCAIATHPLAFHKDGDGVPR
jgi:hypothetical protein